MNDNILPLPVKIAPDAASKKFMNWLDNAKPGDKYCYHTGTHICGEGVGVGRVAFRAFEKGVITLYQKRNGTMFDYWAVRQKWR